MAKEMDYKKLDNEQSAEIMAELHDLMRLQAQLAELEKNSLFTSCKDYQANIAIANHALKSALGSMLIRLRDIGVKDISFKLQETTHISWGK